MKRSEGKMLYHCNLICVSHKHGMHGSLQYLKIVYIHNWRNLFFFPNCCETQITKNYQTSK